MSSISQNNSNEVALLDCVQKFFIKHHVGRLLKQCNGTKEKGVSADIIACVCDEYYSDNGECELNQVVSLIEKRTSKTDISRMDYNERQKLMAYLYRRGFNFDIINKAIDKVCDNCM